jgi:hypothetical protein
MENKEFGNFLITDYIIADNKSILTNGWAGWPINSTSTGKHK